MTVTEKPVSIGPGKVMGLAADLIARPALLASPALAVTGGRVRLLPG